MRETLTLDARARAQAPGAFVDLSRGSVHYELSGPAGAPAVTLVHGALSPLFIWDHLAPALRDAGFRVLRYDNYGRGLSDRPRARYDEGLYVGQLGELLDAVGLVEPVHLAGVSQGGAIAAAFSARRPDRVGKLALLAPAGLPRTRSLPERLAVVPGVGEVLVKLVGKTLLFKGQSRGLVTPEAFERFKGHITEQMRYEGFQRSLLAMLRDFPMNGLRADYEQLGRQDRDIFLLWGTADGILPFELSHQARELLPGAEFHAVEGGGHVVHWEEPERVNPLLLEFFES